MKISTVNNIACCSFAKRNNKAGYADALRNENLKLRRIINEKDGRIKSLETELSGLKFLYYSLKNKYDVAKKYSHLGGILV